MCPREGAPPALEKGNVAEPPTVGAPGVLEAHRGGQAFLDRREALHLSLDLESLGHQALGLEAPLHACLIVGEARDLPRLLPLVDVEGDHAETAAGAKGPGRALDDGVGGAEMGRHDVRSEAMVFLALGIRFDEVDVPDLGLLGQTSRFLDRGGVPLEAPAPPPARREREGTPPPPPPPRPPPPPPPTLRREDSQGPPCDGPP